MKDAILYAECWEWTTAVKARIDILNTLPESLLHIHYPMGELRK